MGRAAAWALVVAILLCAIAGFWVGGEMHYRNCLANAVAHAPTDPGIEAFGVKPSDGSERCSRWPF
jgi:hypothetical protein